MAADSRFAAALLRWARAEIVLSMLTAWAEDRDDD